jgi:hypothetical protein
MGSEGGVHLERQGLLPPPRPWIRVNGSRPPLCSLNIVALPTQGEPTCKYARGFRAKSQLPLQSFCARVPRTDGHRPKGRENREDGF